MNPTDFYNHLVASINDYEVRKCARILCAHIGRENKISIEDLTRQVYGEYTPSSDRKTREILEELTRKYRLPVCSLSGVSGRWLASSAEERESSARELEDRARETIERAKALRAAPVPARAPNFDRNAQPGLWG